MKAGDLVLFTGDNGRFDVRISSKGLVLEVRRNPYGYGPDDIEFDALIDGKVVRSILEYDWMEAVREERIARAGG
ncbi:MAG: hypothetical protein FJ167_06580 [Gammaproteobacteria bacterium]|nr:hypothetical protein [Gammaproteobacteria bacterium]